MIKALVSILAGAVAAFESERLLTKLRARFSPRAVTDGFLNSLNYRLEKDRSGTTD